MNSSDIIYHHPAGMEGVELLRLTDPAFEFSPHIHDSYVFWFNGQGGERVSLGGSSEILQPDSFGVVAPGEVHANHAVTERRTLESLYVDQTVVDDIAMQSCGYPAEFISRLQRDGAARRVLAWLHRLLMSTKDEFLARESLIEGFYFLIDRHGEGRSLRQVNPDPTKVRRARSLLDARFGDSVELDWVAAECGCTACHLIRLFRREIGLTPHAYLMERRLSHAKSMLAGHESIAEVACGAGFTDQSHLTNRFKSRFGLTPAVYRLQIQA